MLSRAQRFPDEQGRQGRGVNARRVECNIRCQACLLFPRLWALSKPLLFVDVMGNCLFYTLAEAMSIKVGEAWATSLNASGFPGPSDEIKEVVGHHICSVINTEIFISSWMWEYIVWPSRSSEQQQQHRWMTGSSAQASQKARPWMNSSSRMCILYHGWSARIGTLISLIAPFSRPTFSHSNYNDDTPTP